MVSLVDPGRIGQGLYFVDPYNNNPSTVIFGQALVSYENTDGWWQYAAWYGPDRAVRLARKDPDGDWTTITLPVSLGPNDSHNSIAFGISESDQRLHVCVGQHNDPMYYTRSYEGFLGDGWSAVWDETTFEPIADTLAGTVVGELTYPTFTPTPGGDLLFWYRNGFSTAGRTRLARYQNGAWTVLGDITSAAGSYSENGGTSTSRNLYWATAPMYYGDRLHLIGTWREQSTSILCNPASPINAHHIVYIYSDDDGVTWSNNAGQSVTTPVTVTTPGIHVDATGTGHSLQLHSMDIRYDGMVGCLPDYVRGGLQQCVDSEAERIAQAGIHPRFRDPGSGVWSYRTIKVGGQDIFCQYPAGRAGRGHLVFGPTGDMHVFYPGLRVYSSTVAGNYNDWQLTFDGSKYCNVFAEFQIDRTRAPERVSVLYLEQAPAGATTAAVCVREFEL